MAPHKQSSSGGSHPVGFGPGGKANGYHHQSSSAVAATKKPNMQLIQADHELFLQAFESELLVYVIKLHVKKTQQKQEFIIRSQQGGFAAAM